MTLELNYLNSINHENGLWFPLKINGNVEYPKASQEAKRKSLLECGSFSPLWFFSISEGMQIKKQFCSDSLMTIGKWSFCSCTITSKCQVNKQIHESKEDFFKKNPNLVAINVQLKDLRKFLSNSIT